MSTTDWLTRLPATSDDGSARQAALGLGPSPVGTETVTYLSRGLLLVVGPDAAVLGMLDQVPESLEVRVLLTDDAGVKPSHPDVGDLGARARRARPLHLAGHLGAFRLAVAGGSGEIDLAQEFGLEPAQAFDLVIDLGDPPLIRRQLDPPGYLRAADAAAIPEALAAAGELIGEFEKPRYFDYDPDICVHASRGQSGCNRCLEVCATEAIRSAGDRIAVDPFLCQGCGSCATTCPTGAIHYAWPPAEGLLEHVRALLRQYRDAGGERPVVLFHDRESGAEAVAGWAPDMPESVLPVEVEDIGSIGPDVWFTSLAYGSARVLLVVPEALPASERAATEEQITIAGEILRGLGSPPDRIATVATGGRLELLAADCTPLVTRPATFAALGDKRQVMRKSLAHLHDQAEAPSETQPLPAGAAWGEVVVDREACTLCMACVSVCPVQALIGGGDQPRLLFREDRCVQCGLCERTCPEDAIALSPRIDFAAIAEPTERLRNEEEPHYCPGCGKAFGTRKLIERMQGRLASHWMFGGADAQRRLELCEDCRIEAVMRDEGTIDPYRGE